jgi:hypothetical protein
MICWRTWEAVRAGFRDQISAASPATNGEDIEVPDMVR